MSREWEPGDVAMLHVTRWPEAAEWPDDTSQVIMRLDKRGQYWNAVKGDPSRPFTMHVSQTRYYRPLVVIDPESDADVKRMAEALYCNGLTIDGGMLGPKPDAGFRAGMYDRVQQALREFASPTPKCGQYLALTWTGNQSADVEQHNVCAKDVGHDGPHLDVDSCASWSTVLA